MAEMNIYSKRLNSFRQKRRPSAAAGGKLVASKWPHDQPSAKTLAAAGFYFNQTEGHPDNVTCYLCSKDLDGWEEDDDPGVEHLKHCPDCGWARIAVTQEMEDSHKHTEDPRGARMTNARIDTFGRDKGWWPHEDKESWLPTVKRMAEAGWHYAPTKDSDDFAKCAYCDLSLDGWEPTDDPLEEHRRRSPGCAFFTWVPPKQPTRKTSRASMQSVMAGSDDEPIVKPNKKAPRTKKSKKAELEPENVFEDAPRGRKRTSTAAQQGPVVWYEGTLSTEDEVEHQQQQPAQKKRATRASLAAQQLSREVKKNDSDNESIASVASKVGGKAKAKAKKPAARRTSKVRGNSAAARKTRTQPTVPSDDELDRALALDLERPLTDEEEGFKDFKKPFIRPPTKRLTRSRASLAVEERMRNAPPDSILNSTAKRGRSRTPAVADVERSPTKSPSKRFFRESSQDFSVPVRVPKHLAVEQDLPEVESPGRRGLEDEFAGDTIKVSTKEITDTEMEIEVKPKKAPAKKAARGRKKKDVTETVTATEDEPEASKPKRGKAGAKKSASMRESNATVDSVQEKIELQLQQEQEGRPQKGKKRLVRGTRPKRESVISIASTTESLPEPEPTQSLMDIDHHKELAEASDEGSVIHHDVDALYPTLAPSPKHSPEPQEVEMEEAGPSPEPPKPVKKISQPTKRSTRSSAMSTASTTISSVADSYINSGEDSDMSRQKGRKAAKTLSKKQQVRLGKTKDDALKKGSESFFNSTQSEELKGRKGRRTRSSMATENEEDSAKDSTVKGSVRLGKDHSSSMRGDSPMDVMGSLTSGRGSFAEPSSLRSSFVSANGDVQMAEAVQEEETASASRDRAISFIDNDQDGLSATDVDATQDVEQEEEVVEEQDEEEQEEEKEETEERPKSPVAPTLTRIPLSPVRRGMNVPVASTPKPHSKASSTFHSRKLWTPIDLDTVFANLNASSEESDEGAGVLTSQEREMTVAEWIKWNAAQAESRMKGEAERMVGMFEAYGKKAREAIEALDTVD